MKATLALDFSDAGQAADFFEALAATYRKIAGGVKAAVAALDLPAAGSEGRAGVSAPYTGPVVEQPAQTTTSVPETAAKPPRTRRTKAEMEAARATEAGPALDLAGTTEATADEVPHVTDDELRKKGNALVQKAGAPIVAQILGEFEIKKYPDCPPNKRALLLKRLNDELAKAGA